MDADGCGEENRHTWEEDVMTTARRRSLAIVLSGAVWCLGLGVVALAGMNTLPMLPAAVVAVVAAGLVARRAGWSAALAAMWAAAVAAASAWLGLWSGADLEVIALAAVTTGSVCWVFWAMSAWLLAAALRFVRGDAASLFAADTPAA